MKTDFIFCPYCAIKLPPGGCLNCGYADTGTAKFCPECGTILAETTERTSVRSAAEEPIPASGITLEFAYSSSRNFDLAVEAARQLPSFQEFGVAKKATYRVWVDGGQVDDCLELVSFIRNWKSGRIFVDGERGNFNNTFGFQWCYEQRQASYKPDYYCFGYENDYDLNLWGCVKAGMPFSEHADWWQWGRWVNKKGDWEFDKDRIRHNLQSQLFPIRYCPALQGGLINEVIAALPDKVNPPKDKDWKFVESWGDEDEPGGLKVKVTRYGYEETVVMKGVCPRGHGALLKMIKRVKQHRIPAEIFRS